MVGGDAGALVTGVAGAALPEGEEKRVAVEAMFDRIAPGYERMNRLISLGQDRRWRRRAVDALELPAGSRVLDVGCGTGDLCRELERRGYHAVGLDRSAGMLARAHTASPLVRGEAERLPLGAGRLDGIVSGFALRNVVDLTQLFAATAAALRPGGRFVALDAAAPTNVALRLGNAAWFRGAVPLLGRLVARDPAAYRYLPDSLAYLPAPAVLCSRLEAAGFTLVRRATMTGGSVQLLTGTRA
jgi:demethylmenaquinone methyltransferase/2-methoxy-6-polyprenyl-1,4-benzoquinol methylase